MRHEGCGSRSRTLLLTVLVGSAAGCGGHDDAGPEESSAPAPAGAIEREAVVTALARSYVPDRVGDVAVVPARSAIMTWSDGNYDHMHGSPWEYDSRIPLLMHRPGRVSPGDRPGRPSHQDIGATLMAVLGVLPADSVTGRPLPGLVEPDDPPDLVVLLMLDAFRPDLLDRFADRIPTLGRIADASARWPGAAADYLPTNTATAHTTLSTGTHPRVHGIPGNGIYVRGRGEAVDVYEGADPARLRIPTLADRWLGRTDGAAVVIVQGGTDYPAVALAGRGACAEGGHRPEVLYYHSGTGTWRSGECYASTLAGIDLDDPSLDVDRAMGPSEFRRTAGFARLEVSTLRARIAASAVGADDVPDLILANLKATDYVSHKYGPFSEEMAAAVEELDRQIGELHDLVRSRVDDVLLVITADHGMPEERPSDMQRITYEEVRQRIDAEFDPDGPGIVLHFEGSENQLWLDHDRLAELDLDVGRVAAFLEDQSFVEWAIAEHEVAARAAELPRPWR